ncbi:MAG: hypothetical protein GC168_08210 [Candidatus Hydrogenedens sp.]|nr:hypothetical protein [Candidatus Hydrogenedens sp.]
MYRIPATALLLLLSVTAYAADLRVPEDYASVAEAVAASAAGDTIVIGEGTFQGLIKINHPLTLRGAGKEKSVLAMSGLVGPVLHAREVDGLEISNLTFRHSGERVEDDKLHLVWVEGGKASFNDCAFEKGWMNGLYVTDGAAVSATNCMFTENAQYGCHARDPETTLTLIDCLLEKNREGACVSHGAEGTFERVTARGQERDGFVIFAPHTRVTATDCLAEENTRTGFRLEYLARVELTNCDARSNQEDGVYAFGGVKVTMTECRVEDNKGAGISVNTSRTRVKLERIDCSRNGRQGIYVGTAAEATLTDCKILENAGSGWLASQWDTKVKARGCEVRGNKADGALILNGASAEVSGCTFAENGGIGLHWRDADTTLEQQDNRFEANAQGDAEREDGWPADIGDQAVGADLGYLFTTRDFSRLEYLAKRIRERKMTDQYAGFELESFYNGIETGYWGSKPAREEEWQGHVDAYLQGFPDSVTARVFAGYTTINRAWRARGSGFADTVSDKQFDRFHQLLKDAVALLKEAEALQGDDPALYAFWLKAGTGLSYSEEQQWELLRKGQAIDPTYFPMYDMIAYSFIPRWGGNLRSIEAVADDMVETLGDDMGSRYYAALAGRMIPLIHPVHFAYDDFFDWERIDRGYTAQRALYPGTDGYLNRHIWLACMKEQRERAAELFEELDGRWSRSVWEDRTTFREWELWAQGTKEMPELPDRGDFDSSYFEGEGEGEYVFDGPMNNIARTLGIVFLLAVIASALFTLVVFLILRWQENRAKAAGR